MRIPSLKGSDIQRKSNDRWIQVFSLEAEGAALEAPPRTEWEGHQDSGVHTVTLLGSKVSFMSTRTGTQSQDGGFGVRLSVIQELLGRLGLNPASPGPGFGGSVSIYGFWG